MDPYVDKLISSCPFLADRVDLTEGPYYIFHQVAQAIFEGVLSDSESSSVFSYMHKMARGDIETQNLLEVGMLEELTDSEESIERTRNGLGDGPARPVFEKMLNIWNPARRSGKPAQG